MSNGVGVSLTFIAPALSNTLAYYKFNTAKAQLGNVANLLLVGYALPNESLLIIEV